MPVTGELPRDHPARDEQHVGTWDVGEGHVDLQVEQTVVVIQGADLGGAENYLGAGQVRKHLVGADGV